MRSRSTAVSFAGQIDALRFHHERWQLHPSGMAIFEDVGLDLQEPFQMLRSVDMASKKRPPAATVGPKKKRTALSTWGADEIEPDLIEQGPVAPVLGIAVRPSPKHGSFDLVIDDFRPIAIAAEKRDLPADGFLSAALLDRLRFVLGGAAWNGNFSYGSTSRAQCVLRGSDRQTLERLAERYRALVAAPSELEQALGKLRDRKSVV